ncbi:MAG: glycosyltransferase [Geminicoccaceae bacterium]
MISAAPNCNLAAVWANRLAGGHGKVLISERTAPSKMLTKTSSWRMRFLPWLMHRTYQQADVIVAVSRALGDDLAVVARIPRRRIITIYNPVVGPNLTQLAAMPVDHPWFAPGSPPVVLSAGRLSAQKDFPTLVRAFAALRTRCDARLVILGGATADDKTESRQQDLVALAESLGVAGDMDLVGYMPNPYAYMSRAQVFALSSAWEGFGNVLVEALACGCPVVSTDCPYGPAEILEGGRYGRLTPVGDAEAMADALADTITSVPDRPLLRRRGEDFTVARSVEGYLHALFGGA